MQRSQQTTARFTRVCQIGACLMLVPILMAVGCPLTVTVNCPADGAAGTAATLAVTVSGGQGVGTWTTAADNGTVADGTTAAPTVTPTAAGTVTVTATATDESGATADGSCTFDATAAACTDDAGCDDGVFCNGAETCDTDAGSCVAGTTQCTGTGESCDEANDTCITACTADADCDDGDACTDDACTAGVCANTTTDCDDADACTTDTCDSATGCVNTDMTCDAGQECSGGTCVTTCVSAADCDDSDPCTDDACASNLCENTAKDCDDGLFCTGTNTCNADTGVCETGTSPCAAGTTCVEATDTCDDQVVCTDDAGCDDGLFCNGTETCDLTDPDAGVCAVGTDPCEADEDCNDTTDTCDFNGTVRSMDLTTASDTGAAFVGTSGNDVYQGQLFLSGGNFFQTLNNSDSLDGAGGTDTLSAQFNPGAATSTTPSMANIEIFNFEVTTGNPQTVSMGNAGSETTINFENSQVDGGDLLITNAANKPTNFGMTNCTENFTVTTTDAALSGTTDECTLTLDGVTLVGGEPTIIIQPATTPKSGYETINIVSQGNVVNTIQDLQQGNGNSLVTINVSGSADLDMNANAVDTTVTTFDASAATGDVDVLVAGDGAAGTSITVKGGSGDDDLDCTDTADENFTVDAGAGDDKITFNANYDSTSPFTDTIDGGAGTDTLVVVSADAITTTSQTSVTNIETLQVSDALAGDLDAGQYWGAITKVTLAAGIDGTTRTITLPDGGTLDMNADAGTATHILRVTGTATTDDVTLDLADGVDFVNPLTVTGIETLTIKGPSTAGVKNIFNNTLIMTASAGGSTTIIITGANEVEFVGAITAGIIDGSACTGVIDIQVNMAGASSILGGTAGDLLTGSDANDVLSGGPGADTIDGQGGDDTLTGGAGADTFLTVAGDQSTNPSDSVFTSITDFESDSDIINDTAAALAIVSGTTNFGVGTASISTEGFCTFNAADDTLAERIIAAEDGIVENAGAAAGQFALFTHGSHTYLFISDGVDAIGANDVLIQFANVTGLSDTTLTGGDLTIK